PTTDRIKETLFNMLQTDVAGAVFLDLFSGSGGIAIEALSRGAARAYLVENSRQALKCIQENLHFTKMEDRAVVLGQDVFAALSQIHEKQVNIIFMDPPYHQQWEQRVLERLADKPYVTQETKIIVEASLDTDFSYLEEIGFAIRKEKVYKTNKHVFVGRKTVS
ncbi:MAG: 16S rRNA (guanine(966)-N(2))-methyltransferase RsmD, partial [Lachnospiraceae bacterium]